MVVGWLDAFVIEKYPQVVDSPNDLPCEFTSIGFVGFSKGHGEQKERIEIRPQVMITKICMVFIIVTTLIKRLIRGTYQGRFESKYLKNYLDEYIFRFNRRKRRNIGIKFMRIVQQVVRSTPITWNAVKCDMDPISEYLVTT